MEQVAVIDFETTGLSPKMGDRATEIAAVLVCGGKIVDRYQSLMRTGTYIPAYVEELTGITNEMVRNAPKAEKVMREVALFVGKCPLVAHNASFDSKFWDHELSLIGKERTQEFACSMLVARRVFQHAPSHKLSELISYAKLPITGRYHRALADAEMTSSLLLRMEEELQKRYKIDEVSHELLRKIQSVPKAQMPRIMSSYQKR